MKFRNELCLIKKLWPITLCTILLLTALLLSQPVAAATGEAETASFGVTWESFPTYDGAPQEPTPIISFEGNILTLGTDYTLSYSNNIDAGAEALLSIDGIGSYAGISGQSLFAILPANIADSANISISNASYIGVPVFPSEEFLTDLHGTSLKRGEDYTAIYTNNVKAGEATVRFIGIGNYTGYCDKTFTISATDIPDETYEYISPNNIQSSYIINAKSIIFFQSADSYTLYKDGIRVRSGSVGNYTVGIGSLTPGYYKLNLDYKYYTYETGWYMDADGVMRKRTTKYTHYATAKADITIVAADPTIPQSLIALPPVWQGVNKLYLEVDAENDADIGIPTWESSDPNIATVFDGIVTLHSVGAVTITATVGELTAVWDLSDIAPISLSNNSFIYYFDGTTGLIGARWKDHLLQDGIDYTSNVTADDNYYVVSITGINSFSDTISAKFCKNTNCPIATCSTHKYDNGHDAGNGIKKFICVNCYSSYEIKLVKLTLLSGPTQTRYAEGSSEIFSEGIILNAEYSNGLKEQIQSGYSLTITTPITTSDNIVTIEYLGLTTSYKITVYKQGWYKENDNTYYYENGKLIKDTWKYDSTGLVYLGEDGAVVIDAWLQNSSGPCFVGSDGHVVTDTWKQDSTGWCYLDKTGSVTTNKWINYCENWYYLDEYGHKLCDVWKKDSKGWVYLGDDGAMLTNAWVRDSVGWCYVGADGYAVTNCWKQDSVGWCYLDANGSMTKNAWVLDGGKWYFLDGNGYMVSNKWMKDSKGWVWLEGNGAMATNKWVRDSKGWCYVGADGYAVTNCWKKDSVGWCYLDSEGSMTKNAWVKDGGKWYYCDGNGYMISSCWRKIGGYEYYFHADGHMAANERIQGYWVDGSGHYVPGK